jgi:galactokinase
MVMNKKYEQIKNRYLKIYLDSGEGDKVTLVRAPGRAVLLGEYTDFLQGHGLALNTSQEIVIACQRRSDGIISMYSMDFEEKIQTRAGNLRYLPEDGWANYVKSALWAMENAGYKLSGMNMLISGNITQSSGMASSTALQAATAHAVYLLEGGVWEPVTIAKHLHSAQTNFLKVKSSYLDSLCLLAAKAGNVLYADTKTLQYENLPAQFEDISFLLLDSGITRNLKSHEAAARLAECEEAFQILKKKNDKYESLSDVKLVPFERYKNQLPAKLKARAEHIIHENDRVLKAKKVLEEGDISALGELMNRSHLSVTRLFQAGSEELNSLVSYAQGREGVFGAKLNGGGFGGAALILLESSQVDALLEGVKKYYRQKIGLKVTEVLCEPVDPVSEIKAEEE